MQKDITDLLDPNEPSITDKDYEKIEVEIENQMVQMHANIGPQTIVLNPMDTGGQMLEFTIDGTNDPDYIAAISKYRKQAADESLSREDRRKMSLQIFKDVYDRKQRRKAEAEKMNPTTAPDAGPAASAPKTPPKRTEVVFDFGDLGSIRAKYAHVVVDDKVVVLANDADDAAGTYAPPAGKIMVVGIDGYPAPMPVVLVGSVKFAGYQQVILVVYTDED